MNANQTDTRIAGKVNRREFLLAAGVTAGAATLLCGGLGYLATVPPDMALPELNEEEDNRMSQKILVVYATKAGSTAEIAVEIGKSLAARGYGVDVKPVKEDPSLDGYQAVVIGSAIRIGRWLSEADQFVRKNQARLNQLPAALFTVHLENLGEGDDQQAARRAYTEPIRQLLPEAQEVFFPGKIDFDTLSFFDRTLAKAMAKQVGLEVGDFRDWEMIKGWAGSLFT